MQILLSQIIWDDDLYPRVQLDWKTAHEYTDALKAGANFPPIHVVKGDEKGTYIGLDGRHRWEAHRRNKLESIEAMVVDVPPDRRLLYAVDLNIKHGRRLSPFEKIKIAQRLQEHKISLLKIAEVLQMPKMTLTDLLKRRQSAAPPKPKNGKWNPTPTALKSPLSHLAGKNVSSDADASQRPVAAGGQVILLKQVAVMMEAGVIDLSNEGVKEMLTRMWSWMGEHQDEFFVEMSA